MKRKRSETEKNLEGGLLGGILGVYGGFGYEDHWFYMLLGFVLGVILGVTIAWHFETLWQSAQEAYRNIVAPATAKKKTKPSWYFVNKANIASSIFACLLLCGLAGLGIGGHMLHERMPSEWPFLAQAILIASYVSISVIRHSFTLINLDFAGTMIREYERELEGPLSKAVLLKKSLAGLVLLRIRIEASIYARTVMGIFAICYCFLALIPAAILTVPVLVRLALFGNGHQTCSAVTLIVTGSVLLLGKERADVLWLSFVAGVLSALTTLAVVKIARFADRKLRINARLKIVGRKSLRLAGLCFGWIDNVRWPSLEPA